MEAETNTETLEINIKTNTPKTDMERIWCEHG
jgi:hypothetical protein